jgi:hypothetical protein
MLSKFFASWLLVLVIAPFTAPFPTCDATSLFGSPQGQDAPAAPSAAIVLTTDEAVPSAVFVASIGRIRLLPLSRVPLTESALPFTSAAAMGSDASADSMREPVALSTILRV